MHKEGILSAIGGTPLIRLSRLSSDRPLHVYAKLEFLNPGGSTKDRAAYSIIKKALDSGELHSGSVIVESSSGNMAIALAQVCGYFGLKLICVVDPKTTGLNLQIMRALGAQIDLVDKPDPETGEFLTARLKRVQQLLHEVEHSFWPNQYANRNNANAHYETTMREIAEQAGDVDYLFCGVSTCGTIHGCVQYIRDHRMKTKVIAVDAVGSIIFGGEPKKRLLPGIGAVIVPELCPKEGIHEVIHVSDMESIYGCRKLLKEEAILVGGSSGGVVAAFERFKEQIPDGSTCALLFPDRGERYLDTIYSDEWVKEHKHVLFKREPS